MIASFANAATEGDVEKRQKPEDPGQSDARCASQAGAASISPRAWTTCGRRLGNHLESLVGDRKGKHSIRVNAQWRICFRWVGDHGPGCGNRRLSLREEETMKRKSATWNIHPGEILREDF